MRSPAPLALRVALLPLLVTLLTLPASGAAGDGPAAAEDPGSAAARLPAGDPRRAFPGLSATRQVTGLVQPWDVQVLPGIGLLIGERDPGRLYVARGGTKTEVALPADQVWASGETGLMGLAVDPRFRTNRRFYACHGGFAGGGRHDVRVTAWRLSADGTRADLRRVLLRGIDATTGRHGGCRLLIARDGALLVGTGDAAVGRNPQNLRSLGGKVLRLKRWSGKPWRGNPWSGADHRKRRFVLTYGHRNVQGLAQRADGTLWSVEHGTRSRRRGQPPASRAATTAGTRDRATTRGFR